MEQKNIKKVIEKAGLKYEDTLFGQVLELVTVGEAGETIRKIEMLFAKFELERDKIHNESHLFGYSKVMWLSEMEKCLNEFYNKYNIYANWRMCNNGYEIILAHKAAINPEAYSYFGIQN